LPNGKKWRCLASWYRGENDAVELAGLPKQDHKARFFSLRRGRFAASGSDGLVSFSAQTRSANAESVADIKR